MRISDLIIETYIAESALLKTEKLIKLKQKENCQTQIYMTQNYINHALSIAQIASQEIIMSTTKGLKNKLLLSIARKLVKPLPINIKEVRRHICNKLEQDGKYNFTI